MYFQGTSNTKECPHADIAFATFNAANIVSVQPRFVGKLLLAQPLGLSKALERLAQRNKIFVLPHPRKGCRSRDCALHTISVICDGFILSATTLRLYRARDRGLGQPSFGPLEES